MKKNDKSQEAFQQRLASVTRLFQEDMTVKMLLGTLTEGIIVIDETGKVVHTQLVPEIGDEPDYDATLSLLQ